MFLVVAAALLTVGVTGERSGPTDCHAVRAGDTLRPDVRVRLKIPADQRLLDCGNGWFGYTPNSN
jgi:hypothetical protein